MFATVKIWQNKNCIDCAFHWSVKTCWEAAHTVANTMSPEGFVSSAFLDSIHSGSSLRLSYYRMHESTNAQQKLWQFKLRYEWVADWKSSHVVHFTLSPKHCSHVNEVTFIRLNVECQSQLRKSYREQKNDSGRQYNLLTIATDMEASWEKKLTLVK